MAQMFALQLNLQDLIDQRESNPNKKRVFQSLEKPFFIQMVYKTIVLPVQNINLRLHP